MVKPIMKDILFLKQKSIEATKADMPVVQDLLDTLRANEKDCVGMAANMIGVNKRIIVVTMGPFQVAMINPVIVNRSKPYETTEGCLSLSGVRNTTRYEKITVEYYDVNWQKQKNDYSGWIAQIIQHECDHLEGIII